MDENTVQQKQSFVTNVKKTWAFSSCVYIYLDPKQLEQLEKITIHSNVEAVNTSSDPWNVTLLLDGISIKFKMDTRADVTAVPSHIFDEFTNVRLSGSD